MSTRIADIRKWLKPDWAAIRKKVVAMGCYGLLALVGLFVEEYLNPFGVVEAIKEHSAIVLQQVAAPLRDIDWWHPWSDKVPFQNQNGQNAVTVVLIDQGFIDLLNATKDFPPRPCMQEPPRPPEKPAVAKSEPPEIRWPLPVSVLMQCVLGPIALNQPKAIFLDIAFPDVARQIERAGVYTRRASAEALGEGLAGREPASEGAKTVPDAGYRSPKTDSLMRNIPLLIGTTVDPAVSENLKDGPECVNDTTIEQATLTSPFFREAAFAKPPNLTTDLQPRLEVVSVNWQGGSDIYPLIPKIVASKGSCGTALKNNKGFLISPALRLFQLWQPTKRPGTDKRPSFFGNTGLRSYTILNEHWKDDYRSSVMVPMWGAHLSSLSQTAYSSAEGADDCTTHQGKSLWMAFHAYFSNIIGKNDADDINPCPYIDTIYASSLFDKVFYEGPASKFLGQRLVLVGVDLPVTTDRIRSPINQDLPGVYAHAAALENLIRFSGAFHNEAPGAFDWAIITFVFLVTLLISEGAAHRILHHMRHLPEMKAGALLWLCALAGLLLGLMSLLTLSALLMLLGTSLPAKDMAIPLFFAHLSVWKAITEEIEGYIKDVFTLLFGVIFLACRRTKVCLVEIAGELRDLLIAWLRSTKSPQGDDV